MTTSNFYLHSANTARTIDNCATNTLHIPSLILMEHAAIECANFIIEHSHCEDTICIVCGPGNNGGDGLALARILQNADLNYKIFCYCPKKKYMSDCEKIQFDIIKQLKIPYTHIADEFILHMESSQIIVDALFGNGLSRNIDGEYMRIIDACNNLSCKKISIDIPSGIHATTGCLLGCAFNADFTISLDCFKFGQWIRDGKKYCGKTICVDIGIPKILHENVLDPAIFLNKDFVRSIFPYRSLNSHKGSFGKALMIGGSASMPGAISMAAKACYRSGIGTLTLMIPHCIGNLIASKFDFAMLLRGNSRNETFDHSALYTLKNSISKFTHISIGNGMQKNSVTEAMTDVVLHSNLPAIIDADAIGYVGKHPEWLDRNVPTILTPHIKEMSELTHMPMEEILEDPFECVHAFCLKHPDCVIVLKSSQTIIGQNHKLFILNEPNDCLAKGGSGDLLCGIITGLFGQCQNALVATICGVYVHSLAAKTSLDGAVFQPDDLLNNLNNAFKSLR